MLIALHKETSSAVPLFRVSGHRLANRARVFTQVL
jgi:hypothetical protein